MVVDLAPLPFPLDDRRNAPSHTSALLLLLLLLPPLSAAPSPLKGGK